MPAIITSPFRVQNAQRLVSAVTTEAVYITVGKSDDWASSDTVVTTPTTSPLNIADTTGQIIAMKKVINGDASLVIPMVRFTAAAFKEYDPSSDTNFISGTVGGVACLPAYCVVQDGSNYRVYKCLSNLKNGSGVIQAAGTVAPTTVDYAAPQIQDGYLWAYMFTATSTSNTFTTSFVPVSSVVNTSPDITSNAGKIYGYKVISGGAGYSPANATYTNVAVTGNGSGASATITVAGGIVTNAVVYTTPTPQYGSGYTRATFTLTGAGTPSVVAVIQPLYTPVKGHGYDPANELSAYYAVFSVKFNGSEDTDLPAANDFRQVGLLLNPLNGSDTAIVPSGSGYANAQKTLVFSAAVTTAVLDGILHQPSTGAKAFVDSITGSTILYHQNYSTLVNFIDFTTGSVVNFYSSNGVSLLGNGSLSSITAADYKKETGQLLFIENRAKITRADAQTEDVKIVIQF